MFGVINNSVSGIAIAEGFFSIVKKLLQFIGNIWVRSLFRSPIINKTFYGRGNSNQQSKNVVEKRRGFPDNTEQVLYCTQMVRKPKIN